MDNPKITFEATIVGGDGKGGAYVEIPFDVKETFGSSRPKVKAIFDDAVPYRGMLVRMKTPFHFLILNKEVRTALDKTGGDNVKVTIEKDTEPRIVEVPDYIQAELDQHPAELEFYQKMSFTHQKEYIRWVTGAKKEETRLRRLKKMIIMLKEKKKGV